MCSVCTPCRPPRPPCPASSVGRGHRQRRFGEHRTDALPPRRGQWSRRRRRCRRRPAQGRPRRLRTSRRCTSTDRRSRPASCDGSLPCRRPAESPSRRCARRDSALPSAPWRRFRRCAHRSSSRDRATATRARRRNRTGAPSYRHSCRWAARPASGCGIAPASRRNASSSSLRPVPFKRASTSPA